jgi:acyl-CoA reductase-like NAD-dependent aldehyde dehydrogenase
MTSAIAGSAILPKAALWIGGEAVTVASGGAKDHVDPASGRSLKGFPLAGSAEVDQAVAAARAALPRWRDTSPAARRDILLAISDLLRTHGAELAAIGALDAGTPVMIGAALSSIVPADWFRYYAGWADKLEGSVPAPGDPQTLIYTRRVPFGVVALITAFNAPMAFMGMKVAAALAAGNTIVLKPSELAPWTVLRFTELCREAGLPAGVLNVIPGGREAGEALVGHPGIDRIGFTGGGQTARAIMRGAAANLTPVSFELGGKSASIIFDDADIGAATALAIQGSVALLSGQACIAGTRILIQRGIYEETLGHLKRALDQLPVGDPSAPGTVIGPMINDHHCRRIMGVIDGVRAAGDARLITGGERVGGALAGGYFIAPTLFADVDPDSHVAQEEIFGPVLVATPFDSEEDAIAIANNSAYGLAGYVFTGAVGRAHRVAQRIEAGLVTVNTPFTVAPNIPFGGFKASGFGREGGPDGIIEMTHTQSIMVGIG